MTIYRLEHFPNVCRLCLKYVPDSMTPLDEPIDDDEPGTKLLEVLNQLTFPLPTELIHLTPSAVCDNCMLELQHFLAYRKRLNRVLKFIFCLAQVRRGKSDTLVELFTKDHANMLLLLKELEILENDDLVVSDLLSEFSQYAISTMSVQMKREESNLATVKIEANNGDAVNGLLVEYLEPYGGKKRRLTSMEHELSDRAEDEEALDGEMEMLEAEELEDESYDELERLAEEDMVTGEEGGLDSEDQSEDVGDERKLKPTSGSNVTRKQTKGELQHCNKCKFKTFYPLTFKVHMEKHIRQDNRRMQSCKRCYLDFESKKELDRHKRTVHRDFMCDTCGLAFEQRFALETHRKRHEEVRQYKCEYCPMEYYTKAEKILHVKQLHLKTFEVKCPDCGLSFKTKSMLNQHVKSHTNQRTHTCSVCGYGFKSYTHLNRHIKSVHQDQRFQCDHCDVSYGRKDKLRLHVEKAHNIQTYFVCDICLQSFNSKSKLDKHRNHHENPKALQCGICLGAYLTTDEFSSHLCIEYKDNYQCCNRDFKYHYYYNKHMFLAHGEKTNVRVKPETGMLLGQLRAMRKQSERCTRCEQEFPTRNQKKQHMAGCRMMAYEVQYIDNYNVGEMEVAAPVEEEA